jgi:hypothetical protein
MLRLQRSVGLGQLDFDPLFRERLFILPNLALEYLRSMYSLVHETNIFTLSLLKSIAISLLTSHYLVEFESSADIQSSQALIANVLSKEHQMLEDLLLNSQLEGVRVYSLFGYGECIANIWVNSLILLF